MKIGVYFLFYVAMILELMIFIVEKEDAEQVIKDENSKLISAYESQLTRPLKITGPGSLTVGRKEQGTFIFTVSPLWSKSEQEKLRYAYTSGRFWTILPETALVGVMKIQIDGSKLDDRNPNVIALQCMTYRSIPEELPLDVQDTLRVRAKRILGPDMEVISNEIKIPVKSGGKPVAPDLQ